MSQVFGIARSHVEGELRLGRAIERILKSKVPTPSGYHIVPDGMIEGLQRAYDKTFPAMDKHDKDFLKAARRFKARKR